MEPLANTTSYMILGYTIIFGTVGGYILSLFLRQRKYRQEEQMLEEIEKGTRDSAS